MKLRDFLELFEGMDPELPVCVDDYRHQIHAAEEVASADWVRIEDTAEHFRKLDPKPFDSPKFVIIGAP